MNGEHTTFHKGYVISYWNKNTAVGCNDDWDHANVRAAGQQIGIYVDNMAQLQQLKALLDDVHQKGKEAQQKEFKKVLGIHV